MAEIQSRVLARAVATATRDALARRESIALLHGSEAAEVMKSKRAGGMDAGLLAVSVEVGNIRQLQDGKWYVHCKHCAQEKTEQARNEEEAYGMLNERKWRLSMPGKKYEKRNWSCPSCAELWSKDTTPTATDAAGSAGQRPRSSTFVRCSAQRGRAAEGGGRDAEGGGLAVEGAAPRAHAYEGGTCE